MPVTLSTHVVGHAQVDGRRYVTETHTLNVGAPVIVSYLAATDADYVTIRDGRVAQINEGLAEAEADEVTR